MIPHLTEMYDRSRLRQSVFTDQKQNGKYHLVIYDKLACRWIGGMQRDYELAIDIF